MKELLKEFRKVFEEKISAKNSWGKNEVMAVFRECMTDVIIEYLDLEKK